MSVARRKTAIAIIRPVGRGAPGSAVAPIDAPIRIRVDRASRTLNIVAFSDCRTQSIALMAGWIGRQFEQPDLIVYAGDDVARFREGGVNWFERLAAMSRYGLVAVVGNDDLPSARELVSGHRVYNVHTRGVQLGSLLIIGVDGAPIPDDPDAPAIGATLHTEPEIRAHLASHLKHRRGLRPGITHCLVVSHTPPLGTLDHAVRWGSRHIGSRALAEFCRAKTTPPALVVCGHVHLQGGQSGRCGRATVANAASHDDRYSPLVVAEIAWRRSAGTAPTIRWDVARVDTELTSIDGIGNSYARALRASRIRTIRQLARAEPERVGTALGWRPARAARLIHSAVARLEGRAISVGPFKGPLGPRVFFDIETDPFGGWDYCWAVGCLDEVTGEYSRFFAEQPSQERRMLAEFASYAETLPGRTFVAYSGCNFDRLRMAHRLQARRIAIPRAIEKSIDVLHPVRRAVALPSRGFGLKEAAQAAGFVFRHPEYDGLRVASEYHEATRRGRPVPKRLLEYHEDDVRGLAHLVHFVEGLASNVTTVPST